MSLFETFIVTENEKASSKEIAYIHSLIDKTYNEWRKITRRINAVDIITTTVNRIIKIAPGSVDKLNFEDKAKMAIILMRCMDNAFWKPVQDKKKIYEKLFPLISKLQNFKINTGTEGTLKDIICTRLSANIAMQDKKNTHKVVVVYEPKVSEKYIRFLFGSNVPEKVYRMEALNLSHDFNILIDTLTINYKKALKKFEESQKDKK
jgi:hypothetical protein